MGELIAVVVVMQTVKAIKVKAIKMDNMYVIGYRFDLVLSNDFDSDDEYELESDMVNAGISIDGFPGEKWMMWPSSRTDVRAISIWSMEEGTPICVDYRCPIDRSELWQDLRNGKTFDVPATYAIDVESLKLTDVYRYLVNRFGESAVQIRWGIAIMLG